MVAALAFKLAFMSQDAELPEAKMGQVQLVSLVAGAEPNGGPDEQEAMQKAHLAFLEGLWTDRKALVLGPIAEGGNLRGLVVLDVEKPELARDIMAKDPWVTSGALNIETQTWFMAKNYILKGPKFMDLTKVWFGTLTRPEGLQSVDEEQAKKLQEGHMANIVAMAKSGLLLIAGPIADGGALRGIFVFKDVPQNDIRKAVQNDPLIKQGRLKLTLKQWSVAKGSFLLGRD